MIKIHPKPCPFCFGDPYFYKTFNGLIRHIQYTHVHDKTHKLLYPDFNSGISFIRKDTSSGLIYISVQGWEEVEEFLEDYVKGIKNPSKKESGLWKDID